MCTRCTSQDPTSMTRATRSGPAAPYTGRKTHGSVSNGHALKPGSPQGSRRRANGYVHSRYAKTRRLYGQGTTEQQGIQLHAAGPLADPRLERRGHGEAKNRDNQLLDVEKKTIELEVPESILGERRKGLLKSPDKKQIGWLSIYQ